PTRQKAVRGLTALLKHFVRNSETEQFCFAKLWECDAYSRRFRNGITPSNSSRLRRDKSALPIESFFIQPNFDILQGRSWARMLRPIRNSRSGTSYSSTSSATRNCSLANRASLFVS